MKEIYLTLAKKKTSDKDWHMIAIVSSYEEAVLLADYHFKSYACFKIEKIYMGAKYYES